MEYIEIKNELKVLLKDDMFTKKYKNFVIFGREDDDKYVFGEIIDDDVYFTMHHIFNFDKFIEVLCEKLNVSIEELYNILKESDDYEIK